MCFRSAATLTLRLSKLPIAHKSLFLRYHPSKNLNNPDADVQLQNIKRAYEVLSDPAKRAGYDAALEEDDSDASTPGNESKQSQTADSKEPDSFSSKTAQFENPNSNQYDVNQELYKVYLGEKNQGYYLEKFALFDSQGDGMHISWNWPAFLTLLFSIPLWALYRKIYGWFFSLFILFVILYTLANSIPVAVMLIAVTTSILFGMYANVLYYRMVKATISNVLQVARDDKELIDLLRKKGGIHSWIIWLIGVWAVFVIAILVAVAIPAYQAYQKHEAATNLGTDKPANYFDKFDLEQAKPDIPESPLARRERMIKRADAGDATDQFLLALSFNGGDGLPEDTVKAVYYLKKAAEQGHSGAQYFLGIMYGAGRGVPRDTNISAFWNRKAAEQGYARAQDTEGWKYYEGENVPQDYSLAASWFRKAAEQGDSFSQRALGDMYANGEGVSQDYNLAVSWYHKAAEQGNTRAQLKMGWIYGFGKGMPKDIVQAYMWFNLAANSRDPNIEQNERSLAIQTMKLFEGDMSHYQIEQAQTLTRDWLANHKPWWGGNY